MRFTRRSILRKASTLPALTLGTSGFAAAADCSGITQWQSDVAYTEGEQVVYNDALWEAQWWTQANEPEESDSVWVKIGDCGSGGGNESPTAAFTLSPSSPEPGQQVTFDASSSSDADGTLQSYEWAFGDETTATGRTATHTYATVGDYTATLTVTDDAGATATGATTVSVGTGGSAKEDDVFAPYEGTWGDLVGNTQAASTDRVIASFVGDATSGDGVNPGWLTSAGQRPLTDFTDEIQTLQNQGIDVWVAIGGWHGRTVARDASTAAEAKQGYEEIIDTLGVTHIDIDDENAQNGRPASVYQIRNEALAMLQAERPEIKVSYTVPAGRNGIENRNYSPARDMVSDAVDAGVDLEYVNIMTMNFNPTTADIIRSAGEGTVEWLGQIYPNKSVQERWEMLGITPNVGESGFTTDTAQAVVDWAEQQDVGLLTFWALYKSSSVAQSEVFYQFEDDE
ncbi:PKD domain-containing protein [Halocatena marina]|uniref:PKD domain-containing protein n=3 Tax=Halocatena marina TaxID=2934937 RepID=A0ABD5YJF7_9EURY|nr:PKD domain-containing protein [Halocatena marina]